MRPNGMSIIFILLLSSSALVLSTPMAAAQTEDEICNSTTVCLVIGAIFLIMLIYSYYQKQKQAQSQVTSDGRTASPGPLAPQPYGAPGYQYAPQPQQTPGYPDVPQPQDVPQYPSAPQPRNMPAFPSAPDTPGAPYDYEPMTDIAPVRKRKKASSAASCPRCGSANVQNFASGEHKCLDCKKIFMD